MKRVLRLLSLTAMGVLALGLVTPTLGQDATAEATAMASQGGMSTDANGMMTVAANDCSYGGEIKSIQAVDATTVKFTLCYPDPALPSKVAFASFGIHPAAQITATGGHGDLLDHPIGTGPWKLEKWDKGSEVDFVRNDAYWGDKAKESSLIFKWSTEAAARLTELQAGTIDGLDNLGATDFDTVKNDSNLALYPREGLNVLYLGMNNTIKPFDDVKVRQAVAMAIDKQRIVDNFYPPGSSVADQFMPTSIIGYTKEVTPLKYDVDAAKKMIEDAAAADGFTLPLEVKLSYRDVSRSYVQNQNTVAVDLQDQLSKIGIKVTIDVQESGTFLDNASSGKLGLFLLGWGADYPDATNFLDAHFGVGANDSFGNKFKEITEPLTKGGQVADPAARYPFYVQANTAIRDLVPMVPLAHGGNAIAFQARISGVLASPLGDENFSIMEDPQDDNIVWMQNAEPISLYCSDETDGESLRACLQTNESLLAYKTGSTEVVPSLAETYTASTDLTEWTFNLRKGVKFHDGSDLTANDVVTTYGVQFDAASPYHTGRSGAFDYWSIMFASTLNKPAA